MFIEPTITWDPSGFSGYIWLDTEIVSKIASRSYIKRIKSLINVGVQGGSGRGRCRRLPVGYCESMPQEEGRMTQIDLRINYSFSKFVFTLDKWCSDVPEA